MIFQVLNFLFLINGIFCSGVPSIFDLSCIEETNSIIPQPKIIPVDGIDASAEEFMMRPVGTKRKLDSVGQPLVKLNDGLGPVHHLEHSEGCLDDLKILIKTNLTPKAATTPKKPKKSLFSSITPQMTTEYIIEQEIKLLKKPERKEIYKLVLEMIASDNIEDIDDVLTRFLETFGVSRLREFKKDECSYYIFRFMILFGSSNFAKKFGNHRAAFQRKIEGLITIESFRYLLANSPIDSILSVLTGFSQLFISPEMRITIQNEINEAYPHLDLFRKTLVNSIGLTLHTSWKAFLDPVSDLEKLKLIAKDTTISLEESALPVIVDLVLELPDLYEKCLPDEKIKFIRMAIIFDRVEQLKKLLEFDPQMAMFINSESSYSRTTKNYTNLIDECVSVFAFDCFRFLMQIVPEIATVPDENGMNSIIRAVGSNKKKFVEILDEFGIDFMASFKYKEFDNMNLVAYSFYYSFENSMNALLEKFHPEAFLAALKPVWPTINSLLEFVCKDSWKSALLTFVADQLKINLRGPFEYNGVTGDARIFLPSSYGASALQCALTKRLDP